MTESGVFEVDLMAQWLWSTLSGYADWESLGLGDPARIAEGEVPDGALDVGPAIVYFLQDPTTSDLVTATGPYRVMSSGLWTIKAVVKGKSYVPLRPILNRIDLLIQDGTGEVTSGPYSGRILHANRVGQIRYPELDEHGQSYRHQGGQYRILAQ